MTPCLIERSPSFVLPSPFATASVPKGRGRLVPALRFGPFGDRWRLLIVHGEFHIEQARMSNEQSPVISDHRECGDNLSPPRKELSLRQPAIRSPACSSNS